MASADELNRAMREAHRVALRELVRRHPEMTLADLVRLTRGRHARLLRELTIGDLVFSGAALRSAGSGPRVVSTRTPSARANYEQAILSTLDVARGYLSATAIRAKVGGTPAQARAALNRLIAAGKVEYRGQARGTTYRSGR